MKNKTFTIWVGILLLLIVVATFIGLSSRKSTSLPNASASIKSLGKSFDASATIKLKDLVLVADVNKSGAGVCVVEIQEPRHLRGMRFDYNGEDIGVSYKGVGVKLDENSKLMGSVASIIVNAIDKAASDSNVDVALDGQRVVVKGDCESGKFLIELDKKSGSIAQIKLPELDFECNF